MPIASILFHIKYVFTSIVDCRRLHHQQLVEQLSQAVYPFSCSVNTHLSLFPLFLPKLFFILMHTKVSTTTVTVMKTSIFLNLVSLIES